MNALQDEHDENRELFEHFNIKVDKGQSPLRIDKFLFNRIENASRSKIQSAATAGSILVNSNPVKSNYKIKPNDEISIVMAFPPREIELIPENIPIDIVYEDNDILIVNKHAGMVVHPGHGNYSGTLLNALMHHLKDNPHFHSGEQRPGLVHRIDKNTSGLLVVAKNDVALSKLAKQFYERTIDRHYIAIVWGRFDTNKGTITGHIGRSLKDRLKMTVFPDGEYGRHATTHYKIIEELGYVTLLECKLETGRTHQIRVHLEYIGHPLFNDPKYGGDKILKGTTFTKYKQFVKNCFNIIPRHALHAKSLAFKHPCNDKWIEFNSELPMDFINVIDKWRNYTSSRIEKL